LFIYVLIIQTRSTREVEREGGREGGFDKHTDQGKTHFFSSSPSLSPHPSLRGERGREGGRGVAQQ